MVPEAKIFARFPGTGEAGTLPDLMTELLDRQRLAWPACGKGFAALEKAELRTLSVGGFMTRLQWNPQRIVSTAAKVDAESIKARRCFLCVENLPPEQQGILYRDEYLVLCNPAPIFPAHYTVTHFEHRPQSLLGGVGSLLRLSRDMGESTVLFYNGPRCGASAPDHLHFQAVASGSIPAEADLKQAAKKDVLLKRDGVTIWKIPFYGRTHCILTGAEDTELSEMLTRFLAAWQTLRPTGEEPMLNLVSVVVDGSLSLLIFLRSKHRPDDYFKEAEERVLVSPASVDMGGHIVTPVEKDFHAIDGPYLERLFAEVSEEPKLLSDIVHAL